MRATVLVGVRETVKRNLPDPAPGPGQVVVRAEAVGICGSDLSAFRGHHERMVPPLVLGHEFAGIVVAVGADVSDRLTGRRVAVDPLVSCGTCESCVGGRVNLCPNYRVIGCRTDLPGAFAELVLVDASKVWALPDGCSSLTGALIQPLAVSHHAVVDRAGVAAGDEVVILGAGPVGLGALAIALAQEARTTVVDVDPYRLEIARQMGAHRTLPADDMAEPEPQPRVVLECVGGRQSSTLKRAASWARPGGKVVIVGNFTQGSDGVDPVLVKVKELDVLGSQGYAHSFDQVLELVCSRRIDVTTMVSHVLALDDPAVGLRLLDDPDADKAKVVMAATSHAASTLT